MSTAVCRVCLASGNIRMHNIEDIQLLEIYENLTKNKYNAKDGMPNTICYVCFSQLQKYFRFSVNAHRSEKILRELLHSGMEDFATDHSPSCEIAGATAKAIQSRIKLKPVTHNSIIALNLNIRQNLTATATRYVCISNSADITGHMPSVSNSQEFNYDWMYTFVTVKDERVTVKEENTPKEDLFELDDNITKVEYCIKKGTNNELKPNNINLCCDQCSKEFKNQKYLKAHMRSHTEGKTFACSHCTKTFYRKANLNKHIQNHSQEKSYVCDRCSKSFKQRSHLKVHMRIHTGEKLYACEICGKTFNQIANLNKHMGIHTGVKPFSCDVCGKTFLQRAQVKAHMRSHTGEKPYACDRCDMAFSHASPLRKHMRLHTEAKQYVCNQCYVSFSLESSLVEHIRIHTAERPYACDKCSKTFTDPRNLKRHDMQVHSEERLHVCGRCSKTFKRPQHLKKHISSSHCRAKECNGMVFG